MTRMLAVLALVLGGFVGTASAQAVVTPTGQTRTEIRQSQQWQQFQTAIAQGRIDPREAARITRLMDGVQRYQEHAYADGLLTLREQARLERYQIRLDRELARAITR